MRKQLLLILTFSLICRLAYANDVESILSKCSGDDATHPEETACLNQAQSTSEADLKAVQSSFLDHLSASGQYPTDITRARDAFTKGEEEFREYRKKHCEFYAAMAMGGNGAHDIRAACVAALNRQRSEELKWIISNWN